MATTRASEHAEQVALFGWAVFASVRWPELALLHAIPNGGHRNKITAARLARACGAACRTSACRWRAAASTACMSR